MSIDSIIEDFEFLDDWEDRYRYVIELGKGLETLPDEAHDEAHKVPGCVSQVWLDTSVYEDGGEPHLKFLGDSDALIVKGLIAILISLYSGRPAREIAETDALDVLQKLQLVEHLSQQRSNGLRAMVNRMQAEAKAALAA
ncbi:SufE family protein [Tepidamorphus sp. 3E244]|uniref:SufE family protein n=1 Tax=Tepidamorphus sp. 3E244 TaxID=3385498 RepID=UPI0038FC60D5